MSVKLSWKQRGIEEWIKRTLERAKDGEAVLERVGVPLYLEAQAERWETKGRSQGKRWKPLKKDYQEYKKRRYGGGIKYKFIGGRGVGKTGFDSSGTPRPWEPKGMWPVYIGAGKIDMIATSELFGSLIGKKGRKFIKFAGPRLMGTNLHIELIDSKRLQIYTAVDYAEMADEKRTFTYWSKAFYKNFNEQILKAMVGKRPRLKREEIAGFNE